MFFLYSQALHTSRGSGRHYTVFGFEEYQGSLYQQWSMHVGENGSASVRSSTRRCISWFDITRLSVCFFSTFSLFFFDFLSRAERLDFWLSG